MAVMAVMAMAVTIMAVMTTGLMAATATIIMAQVTAAGTAAIDAADFMTDRARFKHSSPLPSGRSTRA